MSDAYTAVVVTVSDKGSSGLREDLSGPEVKRVLEGAGFRVMETLVLPDERGVLAEAFRGICDRGDADLVVSTGGTGFALRDVTPEATMDVSERLAPGLAEAMRAESLKKTPRAMLSRGVAGLRKKTLIINLPGSPKGARENLEAVLPALGHGLEILTGRGGECGSGGVGGGITP
jgi:molybdenum cofactor synthesis domain-containing protein